MVNDNVPHFPCTSIRIDKKFVSWAFQGNHSRYERKSRVSIQTGECVCSPDKVSSFVTYNNIKQKQALNTGLGQECWLASLWLFRKLEISINTTIKVPDQFYSEKFINTFKYKGN